MTKKIVVGLGELLWDLLPGGARLGGAVSNFAVLTSRLGDHGVIASRVGDDELGRDARAVLAGFPVDTSYLQVDAQLPTSSVSVALTEGQAKYTIHEPVAWDALELTPQWSSLAGQADAVCFGTLAQRAAASRETIHGFLAATRPGCMRLLDVNLREPYYTREILERSLSMANVLKMNDGEVPLVLKLLGLRSSEEITAEALTLGARAMLSEFSLHLVCITMGGEGSLLVEREQVDRHPGIQCMVADTVGAGDAFTAAFAHYYLQGAPLAVMNEAGNRWGSWTASQHGAMPPLDEAQRERTEAAIARVAEKPPSAGS